MPWNFLFFLIIPAFSVPYILGYTEATILIGSGIFYIIMIIECCLCKTNKFLNNLTYGENIFSEINSNRNNAPEVSFHVQNYHYESRTRRRNGKTNHERRRVNTHRATEPYRFLEWIDTSPDSSAVEYVKGQKLVRLDFSLRLDYTPQANQSYKC